MNYAANLVLHFSVLTKHCFLGVFWFNRQGVKLGIHGETNYIKLFRQISDMLLGDLWLMFSFVKESFTVSKCFFLIFFLLMLQCIMKPLPELSCNYPNNIVYSAKYQRSRPVLSEMLTCAYLFSLYSSWDVSKAYSSYHQSQQKKIIVSMRFADVLKWTERVHVTEFVFVISKGIEWFLKPSWTSGAICGCNGIPWKFTYKILSGFDIKREDSLILGQHYIWS